MLGQKPSVMTSQLRQGSSFTVTIPLGSAHLPQERIEADGLPATNSLDSASFVVQHIGTRRETHTLAVIVLSAGAGEDQRVAGEPEDANSPLSDPPPETASRRNGSGKTGSSDADRSTP